MQFSVRSARDLGAALRATRRLSSQTQAQVAELAGVSRSYVAEIEGGRSSRLLDLLLDLLRVLDLELIVRRRSEPDG